MKIYCCQCEKDTDAVLTYGNKLYKQRPDLMHIPFWKCPRCHNFVGCHHKTRDRTRPLGVIPTRKMKHLRMKIHDALDPLWRSKERTRTEVYRMISEEFGREFHTGELRSEGECYKILRIIKRIRGD